MMFLRLIAVMRKEFIQIRRDPRSLAMIILQPLVMLVLYGYALHMDVEHLKIVILNQDRTSDARELIRAFNHNQYFDVIGFVDSNREIDSLIERGQASLALVVPQGYGRDLASGCRAHVQLIVDGSDSRVASAGIGYANIVLQTYSSEQMLEFAPKADAKLKPLLQAVDYRPRIWYNPGLNSTYFIVPGLVAVILTMLSTLLTSMTVVRERERGTIEQLFASPVTSREIIAGKILPYVFIALLDVALVMSAGRFVFAVPIKGSIVLLMGFAVIFLIAGLGLGLLISTVSSSQQGAMMIAILVTMLPAILLSGFVFPIASMPKPIQLFTYLIPARYFLVIVRGIVLKGLGVGVLWKQGLYLLILGMIFVVLTAKRFRKYI